MGMSRPEYWSGLPFPPPGDLPNPGMEPRSPALQADSLPTEPPGKLINTGVGSLSLLQGIFATQGSNRSLVHCRWILYQLSYQGSKLLKRIHFYIKIQFKFGKLFTYEQNLHLLHLSLHTISLFKMLNPKVVQVVPWKI